MEQKTILITILILFLLFLPKGIALSATCYDVIFSTNNLIPPYKISGIADCDSLLFGRHTNDCFYIDGACLVLWIKGRKATYCNAPFSYISGSTCKEKENK